MNRNTYFKKERIFSLIFSGILLFSLSLTGCSKPSPESSDESKATTALLGEFTAVTHTGDSVDQTVFEKADVTMINIWTTFCTYCLTEMPDLKSLSEQYEDQGFQVIGIVSDVARSGDETVQEIIDQTGADYMHIIPSSGLRTGFLKDVQSVPTTYFVDAQGNQIGEPYLGARDRESWEVIIKEMLSQVQENADEES